MAAEKKNPRKAPTIAHRSMGDDGGLAVVPAKSTVEVLNSVGSRIFTLLDGNHSHEEIVQTIVAEYDVTEEVARKDLQDFLADLGSREMLASENGSGKKDSADE